MSQATKSAKRATSAAPAEKVVIRVSLRKKKPAPLTAAGKTRLKNAARRHDLGITPELPEWRKQT